MSDEVQKSESTLLKFHESFSTSTGEDNVTLQSADGTAFQFDSIILKAFSSFFRGLRDLPSTGGNMSFPHISTNGLEFVLLYLLHLTQAKSTPKADLSLVVELLDFANTYDIPVILAHIATEYQTADNSDPFIVFAIAAILKDDALLVKSAIEAKQRGISKMPEWTLNVLKERDPNLLMKLCDCLLGFTERRKLDRFFDDLRNYSADRAPGHDFLSIDQVWGRCYVNRKRRCGMISLHDSCTNAVRQVAKLLEDDIGRDTITEDRIDEKARTVVSCYGCRLQVRAPIMERFRQYQAESAF